MPSDDLIPRTVWSGSFHLFGVDIKCHTLSNGRRIIEEQSLVDLLDAMGRDGADIGNVAGLFAWQRDGSL